MLGERWVPPDTEPAESWETGQDHNRISAPASRARFGGRLTFIETIGRLRNSERVIQILAAHKPSTRTLEWVDHENAKLISRMMLEVTPPKQILQENARGSLQLHH